jgi:EAL domain-containing protein (putative c-di-GMP-specific phosphodiesterase class I)/DNA-binding NarL/FixJ family response regulator
MKTKQLDTILIVDDLRTNRMVMKKALENENYTFIEASNGQEAIELAIEHQPNVIIMDGLMPVMDGFEAVQILRSLEAFKRVPILMISSLSDEASKLKAIESGVNDFISKPFEKMELILRCRSYMDIAHTNSRYVLTTKDPHTKMPNQVALRQSLSSREDATIVLMRIDHFRSVDAFYGEAYARMLEKEFVKYLVSYFHSLDLMVLCYHTAPGEFVTLFDDFNRDMGHIDLHQFCKMLHEHIQSYEIELDKFSYDVSATICFASGSENLYEDASFAMDWVIEQKKTYVIMNEVIDKLKEETKENINKVHMVKKAIEEDRIVPYFQPIYDNTVGEITKYETLVRLVQEDGKVLSPFFFLDAAKNGNYYLQITMIMLEKVFAIFKYVDSEVTINLSYIDMASQQVNEKLFKLLRDNPDTAKRVTLELLEDEAIENDTIFEEFIAKVREYGVKIAIDDFGSGYSNFQRIMRINPDFVKIDGSIIKNIATNEKSQVLTSVIHTFSRSLNIKTIAEFVSSEEILRKVQEIGIDYAQGYFIAEPHDKLVTLQSHPVLFHPNLCELTLQS